MLSDRQSPLQKESEEASYQQILKASFTIGGSSVINIILRVIRTKFIAVLLGPPGLGLMGIYTSITSTMGTLAGMGIANSGVRQVAEAVGTKDQGRITLAITTLRRTTYVLGVLGGILLLISAYPISRVTFDDTLHVGALAVLSITVLLETISGGQLALVQGMRRIVDLAKINVLGTFFGTALGIPLIYLFHEEGIVPWLLVLSLMTVLTSWRYARCIEVLKGNVNWTDIRKEARALLRLGLVFMASGLMSTAVAYLIRVMIVRRLGMEAVGQYQAAWALSGLYVGFVLGAMGTDFYPRLTAVVNDNSAWNRLVNEQAEVALLLAVPGILATIIFAPIVIKVFYSGNFGLAMDLLRWQMLGVLLKVAAFPIGYILLAKGAGKQYMLTETLTHLVSVVSSWLCLKWFGLVGVGVAFFVMYVFCWLVVFIVVRRSFGFAWSPSNCRLAIVIVPAVCLTFLTPFWLSQIWTAVIGGFLTFLVGLLFMKRLFKLIDHTRLPIPLKTIACWLGVLSSHAGS